VFQKFISKCNFLRHCSAYNVFLNSLSVTQAASHQAITGCYTESVARYYLWYIRRFAVLQNARLIKLNQFFRNCV